MSVQQAFDAAVAHAQAGRRDDALASYDAVLALSPGHVAALVNRAVLLLDLGRPDEALASCDAAVAAGPSVPEAHANRARALLLLERAEEAIAAADRALAARPNYVRAWVTRADALRALRRFAPAEACLRHALALDPGAYPALASLGSTLAALGRYEEAIAAFDAAEQVEGGGGTAAFQRARVRLLTGDFERGWPDMRARWRSPEFQPNAGLVSPALQSRLTLDPMPIAFYTKRVLIVGEQGIGDQLMFASIVPDVLRIAASVALVCDGRLVRLLKASFPEARVFDRLEGLTNDMPEPEVAVAIGELAGAYRRLAGFPGEPYVAPSPEVAEAWAARLGPRQAKLRVGLSWRGGTAATNGAARSIPLAQLSRLLALKDCEFVSLQYGDHAAEIAQAKGPLRVFPRADIDDFEDLAGLVQNLDLVVSVQTAVVHLAGALGKPCFAMVPVRPEWRYGAAGETMPWYRSVRIFRQDATEAWGPVIDQVVRAVGERAAA